jgi:hypothetical protein
LKPTAARKPWPLRWIVASILLFIVPYTYVNLKFRKTDKAFEPYADMKEQANVKRLLDAGYVRVRIRAERPAPPLPATEIVPAGDLGPALAPAPAGLPEALASTLVEPPRLPAAYAGLATPLTLPAQSPLRLQFTALLETDHEQLGGAEVFVREDQIVIVPTFEPVPGALRSRTREDLVLLTLPAGVLAPGRHEIFLPGSRESLRWSVLVY